MNKKYKIPILALSVLAAVEAVAIILLWTVYSRKEIVRIIVPVEKGPVERGKIAFVLDDWGYSLRNMELLRQIEYPLTLAVLPNLAYSNRISKEAHALGFEVILHLPMEPSEKIKLERDTIMVSMNKKTIKNILTQDLESIAYTRGVSNHMGSAAVKEKRIMEDVFEELKKRGLYFLDSYVVKDSVCSDLARKTKLGFAKRDVFIDNKEDPKYIKEQIYKLKVKARISGKAIGIGHDRRVTLEVLKEIIPELAKEGYKLVLLSDLVS